MTDRGKSSAGGAPPTASSVVSSKSLVRQLPAGVVLAFQTLAATFTNQGNCLPSNRWLTVGLVTFLSATCVFFSFTDSVKDSRSGKVHRGVAVPGRLHIINISRREREAMSAELKKHGLKTVDWVHAVLSLVVFLTIAGNDVGLQNCFFPSATDDTRQLFKNLPLGMAVMSSFLFMIFPTSRKGIRFDTLKPLPLPPPAAAPPPPPPPPPTHPPPAAAPNPNTEHKVRPVQEEQGGCDDDADDDKDITADTTSAVNGNPTATTSNKAGEATDRVLTYSVDLLQLLPTGPVLAFQTLSPSFTNLGKCYHSNVVISVGLVTFLTATCIFCAFTDSVTDSHGKVHRGVALPGRLHVLNVSRKDQKAIAASEELRARGLRAVDWVHAFFTAVVFLTIAGSDVGLQNCFFPDASDDTKQLLKNLPLGMAVMSSFVFIIFPPTRKGISFDDSEYTVITTAAPAASGDDDPENPIPDTRRNVSSSSQPASS